MTLKYDYTFMLNEINKLLCINSMTDLHDKEQDYVMVNNLIANYINTMRKLIEENPNFLSEFDKEQQAHLIHCTFKIRLMSKFNEMLGEYLDMLLCYWKIYW